MSELVKEAFRELYPEKELKYDVSLKYSRKFKAYNANVKLYRNNLIFNFSRDCKKISNEIQIWLIQELMIKILKDKKKTINMDLYNLFMKNVHIAVPKTKTDEILEESFNRVNEIYLNGMVDKPNLQWGNSSTSKLGSYEYGSDAITISSIFKNERKELFDYVMYHEMLHKKFKFQNRSSRNIHHSAEFKKMEAKFENRELLEKEISRLARKHRFGFFNF
jgi:predicted metal-dependent hydrolase